MAANLASLDPLISQLRDKLNATGLSLSVYAEPYHDDLRRIHELFSGLPEIWLLVGHCCFCASLFRGPPIRYYWLVSYWVSFAAGFGGGTLASILMQDPPIWFREDFIIVIYTICWWFITYSPKDIGHKLYSFLPVKALCKASSNVLRARVIMARVDMVVSRFGPSALTAPLFLGTLSGCGGRLICDIAAAAFHLRMPAELAKPSWSLRSALSVALIYVATVHWFPIVPHDVAQAVLISLLVAQGLASDLTGMPVDLTAPFSSIFHTVTNIPLPPEGVEPAVMSKASFEARKEKKEALAKKTH